MPSPATLDAPVPDGQPATTDAPAAAATDAPPTPYVTDQEAKEQASRAAALAAALADPLAGVDDLKVVLKPAPYKLPNFRWEIIDATGKGTGVMSPEVELMLLTALSENKRFTNARATDGRPVAPAGVPFTAEELAKIDRLNREEIADFVVVGWTNFVDKLGRPVPYDARTCRALMAKISPRLFDNLWLFAIDERNHTAANIEKLAGN